MTGTSGSRIWTGADSLGSVDVDVAARDLQRSLLYAGCHERTLVRKVMLSGTPRRGMAEWSSGTCESRLIRTRPLMRR